VFLHTEIDKTYVVHSLTNQVFHVSLLSTRSTRSLALQTALGFLTFARIQSGKVSTFRHGLSHCYEACTGSYYILFFRLRLSFSLWHDQSPSVVSVLSFRMRATLETSNTINQMIDSSLYKTNYTCNANTRHHPFPVSTDE
jgi:hypothetical protein